MMWQQSFYKLRIVELQEPVETICGTVTGVTTESLFICQLIGQKHQFCFSVLELHCRGSWMPKKLHQLSKGDKYFMIYVVGNLCMAFAIFCVLEMFDQWPFIQVLWLWYQMGGRTDGVRLKSSGLLQAVGKEPSVSAVCQSAVLPHIALFEEKYSKQL